MSIFRIKGITVELSCLGLIADKLRSNKIFVGTEAFRAAPWPQVNSSDGLCGDVYSLYSGLDCRLKSRAPLLPMAKPTIAIARMI
ncbi:hypothetical protein SAMN04487931_1328 [Desulfobacula phenolica]|uniref:Uncharacterized protein n=1 Tax=Desulfobacula phenolica TaxID=90732 RepID=A0A1H2KCS2_9BACT|nr:hypothetical protein SAMN04487931_1328 [Desulfobacula phenolica]